MQQTVQRLLHIDSLMRKEHNYTYIGCGPSSPTLTTFVVTLLLFSKTGEFTNESETPRVSARYCRASLPQAPFVMKAVAKAAAAGAHEARRLPVRLRTPMVVPHDMTTTVMSLFPFFTSRMPFAYFTLRIAERMLMAEDDP